MAGLEVVAYIGLGVVGVYVAGKLGRYTLSAAFPSAIPGETNTVLIASPLSVTSQVNAKDLESVTSYDYIIVGTGTAGCVLASRLTEDPDISVLAIESGHSDLKQLFSRIPAAFYRVFKSAADWDIRTTKQENAGNRSMQWPRGKMLGGCSAINAMMFNKGAPDDYDEWARLGNKGWAFKDIEPYMTKAECFTPSEKHKLSDEELAQHGTTGPWQTGFSWTSKFLPFFLRGCEKEGISIVTDNNSRSGINGVAPFQTFIDRKGQRSSAAVAYLTADVCKRPNLKIAVGQTVGRVVFDTSGPAPRAMGVEMSSSSASPVKYLAKATKEVLVCTGAVHTPHVLKLSGIGPEKELSALGIPLIKNLPAVGKNLYDHLFCALVFKVNKGLSIHWLGHPILSLKALGEWFVYGTGPMTTNVADSAAFLRTTDRSDAPQQLRENDRSSGKSSADLEILQAPAIYRNHGAHVQAEGGDYASIGGVMLRPESHGTVTLASASPFDPPVVDPNYFSQPHDVALMIYATKLCRRITHSTGVFQSWDWPGKDVDAMNDAELEKHIRDASETLYHPMCTAKMGSSPTDSVVDVELRVHGVKGLRVIDASVFPTPLACHPCGPVIALAEKAADIIKAAQT